MSFENSKIPADPHHQISTSQPETKLERAHTKKTYIAPQLYHLLEHAKDINGTDTSHIAENTGGVLQNS